MNDNKNNNFRDSLNTIFSQINNKIKNNLKGFFLVGFKNLLFLINIIIKINRIKKKKRKNNFKGFKTFLKTIVDDINEHDKKKYIKLKKIEICFKEKILSIHWYKNGKENQEENGYSFNLEVVSSVTNSIFQLDHIIDNIFGKEKKPEHMSLEIKIIGNEIKYKIFENEPTRMEIQKKIKKEPEICNLIMFASFYYIFLFRENFYFQKHTDTLKDIKYLVELIEFKNLF